MSKTPRTDALAASIDPWTMVDEAFDKLMNESRSIEQDLVRATECIKRIQTANDNHAEDSVAIYCSTFLENTPTHPHQPES